MKTQIWNKTTIIWGVDYIFPWETDIPIDNHSKGKKKAFHSIPTLRIISLPGREPERQGLIEVRISEGYFRPTTRRQEIISRLRSLDASIVEISDGNGPTDPFRLTYRLKKGEQFCNSAIKKAALIMKLFKVEDEKKYKLANFIIIQETLVKTKTGWVPYGDYLRHKHRLPQICSLYKYPLKLEGGLIVKFDYQRSVSNFLQAAEGKPA